MYPSAAHPTASLRSRFTHDSLETASGAQVIVLCFDRLDRDLENALGSIAAGQHDATNTVLRHAQDLIGEMVAMLDVDAWEHAPGLLSIYDYLLRLLATANVRKDTEAVVEARTLLAELGEGFRGAAARNAIAPSPPVRTEPTDTERPRLSVRA
ncbi:flagellar export chaperone FliS [Ilumatobacter sp.]|uniref:flagellar export chaperone FliS n=1 Tax=Ilumatobacter sp. TaxID=1967498 RepID=UPI003B521E5D